METRRGAWACVTWAFTWGGGAQSQRRWGSLTSRFTVALRAVYCCSHGMEMETEAQRGDLPKAMKLRSVWTGIQSQRYLAPEPRFLPIFIGENKDQVCSIRQDPERSQSSCGHFTDGETEPWEQPFSKSTAEQGVELRPAAPESDVLISHRSGGREDRVAQRKWLEGRKDSSLTGPVFECCAVRVSETSPWCCTWSPLPPPPTRSYITHLVLCETTASAGSRWPNQCLCCRWGSELFNEESCPSSCPLHFMPPCKICH